MKPHNVVLATYFLVVLPVTAQPILDFRQLPKEVRGRALQVREFNPDQPRHPSGVSEGGQFARAGKPATPRAPKAPKTPAAPKIPPLTDAFQKRVYGAMAMVPARARDILSEHGVETRIGATLGDVFPEIRGQTIPGAGSVEGMTIDAVGAAYNNVQKKIGIAQSVVWPDGTVEPMPDVEATVLHETGHALDAALGAIFERDGDITPPQGRPGRASDLQKVIDAYNYDVSQIPEWMKGELAYFLQDGHGRGRSETFAELFARNVGGVGTESQYDLRTFFPTMNQISNIFIGAVKHALAEKLLERLKYNPDQPRVPAGLPEGRQFGSGTGTTSKPPKDKPEEKPDEAKVAQLTGGAIVKDTQMKWFFKMDRNDVGQLVSRIEGNNFIGDARREVKRGESFFGVSYASLRVAKFGTVDVDAKGHGTLHPAR